MLIYGASGHGHELANLARICGYELISYIDDFASGTSIVTLEEAKNRFKEVPVLLGVGYPAVRRSFGEKAEAAGFSCVSNLIHPKVELSNSIQIGVGSVVSAGCVLTVDIHIGEHTHLDICSTVSHDSWIGSYVMLCPGVHVCGNVRIESDVFVGVGATIMNGTSKKPIVIGQGATIGAGACVTKSVPSGETWVGVPARPLVRKT